MVKVLDEGIFKKKNKNKVKVDFNDKANLIASARNLMEVSVMIDSMIPDPSTITDKEYNEIIDNLSLVKKRIDKVLSKIKR